MAGSVHKRCAEVAVRGELVVDLAHEQLDALAHLLAEDLGEVTLAVARVVDRPDQRAERGRAPRQLAPQERCEPAERLAALALVEPRLRVPLRPRVVVGTGVDEPELAAVRQQAERHAGRAQQLDELRLRADATTTSDRVAAVEPDGEQRAVAFGVRKDPARSQRLAHDRGRLELGGHRRGLLPAIQPEEPFEQLTGERSSRLVDASAAAVERGV